MCSKTGYYWRESWRSKETANYFLVRCVRLSCIVHFIISYTKRTQTWRKSPLLLLLMCFGFLQFCSSTAIPGGVRPEFLAVSGELASLPCNLSSPLSDDAASLILWYREDTPNPIYTLDMRQVALRGARHFPSPDLEGRAYLDTGVHPPLLKIYPALRGDQGDYKCRVDLRRARTFIHYSRLTVLVPPKVVITDEHGQTMQDVIGPYDEGSDVPLFCEASDGDPQPSVTWWKGGALLDDSYNVTPQEVVRNEVVLTDLQRTDLLVEISCQASNTNLTKPRGGVVMLDLNLRPLEVKVIRRPLSAGRPAQLACEARGARPSALLSWWRDGRRVRGSTEAVLEEGNLTVSTLALTPRPEDHGRPVTCTAAHPTLEMEPIADTVNLNVHFAPQLMLALGTSDQNSPSIREGSHVYFECNIRAHPPVTEVTWYADDDQLVTNATRGVLVDNQSLILQKVGRQHRGMYRCQAVNSEGEGMSDVVKLDIQYSPVCRFADVPTFNVVQGESLNITCDLDADPRPSAYQWTLNNTLRGTFDLRRSHPRAASVLQYAPHYLGDYGTLMCWGRNDAGVQRVPCMVHVVPEGEVTTDLGVLAPSTDEEGAGDGGRGTLSPAAGVLVGVGVALVAMVIIIFVVMRIQSTPKTRNKTSFVAYEGTYFEEEKYKFPSPIKKEPNDSLVEGNEKSPDIIPLPSDIEVYATSVEMCSTSPRRMKQAAEVYFTVESQTCV